MTEIKAMEWWKENFKSMNVETSISKQGEIPKLKVEFQNWSWNSKIKVGNPKVRWNSKIEGGIPKMKVEFQN